MNKGAIGGWLMLAALLMGLLGMKLWIDSDKNYEREMLSWDYAVAMGSDREEPKVERTAPFVVLGLASVTAVCGVVLFSGSSTPAKKPETSAQLDDGGVPF